MCKTKHLSDEEPDAMEQWDAPEELFWPDEADNVYNEDVEEG